MHNVMQREGGIGTEKVAPKTATIASPRGGIDAKKGREETCWVRACGVIIHGGKPEELMIVVSRKLLYNKW